MQVDEGPEKRPALLALSISTVMRESVSVAQGSQSVACFYGSTRSPMHFLSPQNWHPCRFIFVSQLWSGRLFRRLTVSLICRHSAASGLHRSKHSIMAKQFTFCTYSVLEIWLNVGHFPHSLLYSMTNQDLKLVSYVLPRCVMGVGGLRITHQLSTVSSKKVQFGHTREQN